MSRSHSPAASPRTVVAPSAPRLGLTPGEMAVDRARRVLAGGSSADAPYCHVCGADRGADSATTPCCRLPVHPHCQLTPCLICQQPRREPPGCCVVG